MTLKALGITAEYNPFHKGHMYQIEESKKMTNCDVVIAVMSGNFVQRGEPAIIDKFTRAQYACRNGVDLVIELPYIYATQSANQFAYGATTLLKLADVEWISFGSECNNLENLQEIADAPINPDHLHQSMDTGMSFPKAYSLLTSSMRPNDILGVSYLRNIKDTNIKPITIARTSNYLDDQMRETSSALAIRTALKNNEDLMDSTVMKDALQEHFHPWMELYYPYLRTFLLTTDSNRLSQFFLFNEGIENHLVNCAKKCNTWQSFLNESVNYRYTAARIKRTCLQALCQVTKAEKESLPKLDTLRVLAFNDKGREYLHQMRKSEVRFASRFADVPFPYRKMEYRTSLLYTSVMPEEERNLILQDEIGGAKYIR